MSKNQCIKCELQYTLTLNAFGIKRMKVNKGDVYLGCHATPEIGIKSTGLQHGCHQSLILSHKQCQHFWICQQIVTVCKLQDNVWFRFMCNNTKGHICQKRHVHRQMVPSQKELWTSISFFYFLCKIVFIVTLLLVAWLFSPLYVALDKSVC